MRPSAYGENAQLYNHIRTRSIEHESYWHNTTQIQRWRIHQQAIIPIIAVTKLLPQRLLSASIPEASRSLRRILPQSTPIIAHVPLTIPTHVLSQCIQRGIVRMTHDELAESIETMPDVLHGIAEGDVVQTLEEEFPYDFQAVELVVAF